MAKVDIRLQFRLMHSPARESELIEACHESYIRGLGLRISNTSASGGDHREAPYTIEDLEHDVALVLDGKTPERCANWPLFSTGDVELIDWR